MGRDPMAAVAAVLVRYCFCFLLITAAAQEVVLPPREEEHDSVLESSSNYNYCLSWRLGAETNNVRGWWTVPPQCCGAGGYIQSYMAGSGQYQRDVELIVDQIMDHAANVAVSISMNSTAGEGSDDGMDAWVLDVDDTCLSNMVYYKTKRSYGCLPYDPVSFRAWASKARSPAIGPVLGLFNYLRDAGFKVFLVTGRDEEALGDATRFNLLRQGFVGYHRLVMRTASYRGQSGEVYKSEMRRQVMEEGYRIWGNVGDQWSDLLGHSLGNRTFKLPNPMYFVP